MRNNGATTVTELRRYAVVDVKQAKEIGLGWLKGKQLDNAVEFGLPEVDDRYHVWRVALLSQHTDTKVGEIVIDARTSLVLENKTTRPDVIESRILGRDQTLCRRQESASIQVRSCYRIRSGVSQENGQVDRLEHKSAPAAGFG